MVIDVQAVKARVDLVDLAARDVALRKVGRELHGPCPFCVCSSRERRHQCDRFRINADRTYWFCRHCTPTGGDVVAYVMHRDGLRFPEACHALDASSVDLAPRAQRHPAPPPLTLEVPPSHTWRTAARGYLERAQAALWSDVGSRARAYLAGRGLRDETIRAFGLGYQPADAREPAASWGLDGGAVYLERGIVIPHLVDDVVWAINVRRPRGEPKYRMVRGGTRYLFGVDTVLPGELVVLVEGEFDAMLIWQETGGMPVLATAGKRGSLGLRALQTIVTARRVLVAYDSEPEADEDAEKLVAVGPRFRRIRTPSEKDPTDYWKAGGDVRAWLMRELAQ